MLRTRTLIIMLLFLYMYIWPNLYIGQIVNCTYSGWVLTIHLLEMSGVSAGSVALLVLKMCHTHYANTIVYYTCVCLSVAFVCENVCVYACMISWRLQVDFRTQKPLSKINWRDSWGELSFTFDLFFQRDASLELPIDISNTVTFSGQLSRYWNMCTVTFAGQLSWYCTSFLESSSSFSSRTDTKICSWYTNLIGNCLGWDGIITTRIS